MPTLKELGYDVEFSLWVGVFAPKRTPDAVIAKLGTEIKKVATGDQFKTAIANIGDEVAYLDEPAFAKFWDEDAKRVECGRAIDRPRARITGERRFRMQMPRAPLPAARRCLEKKAGNNR